MQQLILNKIGPCTSVYVLEDNVLCEMYEENLDKKSTLGNIYRGRVEDIVNGMQAAFIDIGLEKKAFISTKDAMKKVDVTKEELDVTTKMSDVLKQKQSIMVQVKKEPTGEINPVTGKKIYKEVPDKFEFWLSKFVIKNDIAEDEDDI